MSYIIIPPGTLIDELLAISTKKKCTKSSLISNRNTAYIDTN